MTMTSERARLQHPLRQRRFVVITDVGGAPGRLGACIRLQQVAIIVMRQNAAASLALIRSREADLRAQQQRQHGSRSLSASEDHSITHLSAPAFATIGASIGDGLEAGFIRRRCILDDIRLSFLNSQSNSTIALQEDAALEVRTEMANGVTVYRISGKLDTSTSPHLESVIRSSISGENPRIILDMRELTFISSAGIRVIAMAARQTTAARGGLAIFGLRSPINEVFEIAGLQKMIPVAADETEARLRLGR